MPLTSIGPCPTCDLKHRPEWAGGDCPPTSMIEAARAHIARSEWIFAKTMSENPHWYTVLFHVHGPDRDDYIALRTLITKYGWDRRWHGRRWRTFSLDGYDYWQIHPVINRKPTPEAGWEDDDDPLVLF